MTATITLSPFGPDAVTTACGAIQRATEGYGSLKRLAYRSGIPVRTLERYRSGEREPRWSEIQRLSDADESIRAEIVRLLLRQSPETRAALIRAIEDRP